MVWARPFNPVTVTPAPYPKITCSWPSGDKSTRIKPPRIPIVAEGVCIVTALSCLLSLPPTKRNTPRVKLAASLPVPEFGS